MIRFIFIVRSSRRDRNGNTYHFAQLRSTLSGASIAWHTHSESNAQQELCRALGVSWLDWDALHYENQTEFGERELNRFAKMLDASHSAPTAEDIAALEREGRSGLGDVELLMTLEKARSRTKSAPLREALWLAEARVRELRALRSNQQ